MLISQDQRMAKLKLKKVKEGFELIVDLNDGRVAAIHLEDEQMDDLVIKSEELYSGNIDKIEMDVFKSGADKSYVH